VLAEGTERGNARFLVKKYYPTLKNELEEKPRIVFLLRHSRK
jgi:hypothetical protein